MPNDFLNLSPDEELVTYRRRRKRSDAKAPFFIAGLGGNNRNGESMNLIRVLGEVSRASHQLFSAMVDVRAIDTNVVTRDSLLNTPGINARYVDNHLPDLIEAGLVKRVHRGRYLINPYAVMPPNGTDARAMWNTVNHVQTETETAP